MAPLEVIGAGHSRTGTRSLRDALNLLGYNTFHGFDVLLREDLDISIFYDAFYHPDKSLEWDKLYDGYDAAVDMPTAAFVGPLMKQYPDAKIILVERDFESWYESVRKTIYWSLCEKSIPNRTTRQIEVHQFLKSDVLMEGILKDKESFLDKERVRAIFEKHNNWVKENVPADKLLIMKMGEGWERICPFLGKEIPDVPFPCVNTSDEFKQFIYQRNTHLLKDEAALAKAN